MFLESFHWGVPYSAYKRPTVKNWLLPILVEMKGQVGSPKVKYEERVKHDILKSVTLVDMGVLHTGVKYDGVLVEVMGHVKSKENKLRKPLTYGIQEE